MNLRNVLRVWLERFRAEFYISIMASVLSGCIVLVIQMTMQQINRIDVTIVISVFLFFVMLFVAKLIILSIGKNRILVIVSLAADSDFSNPFFENMISKFLLHCAIHKDEADVRFVYSRDLMDAQCEKYIEPITKTISIYNSIFIVPIWKKVPESVIRMANSNKLKKFVIVHDHRLEMSSQDSDEKIEIPPNIKFIYYDGTAACFKAGHLVGGNVSLSPDEYSILLFKSNNARIRHESFIRGLHASLAESINYVNIIEQDVRSDGNDPHDEDVNECLHRINLDRISERKLIVAFCPKDSIALRVVKYAHNKNISPDRLRVISFDGTPSISTMCQYTESYIEYVLVQDIAKLVDDVYMYLRGKRSLEDEAMIPSVVWSKNRIITSEQLSSQRGFANVD